MVKNYNFLLNYPNQTQPTGVLICQGTRLTHEETLELKQDIGKDRIRNAHILQQQTQMEFVKTRKNHI